MSLPGRVFTKGTVSRTLVMTALNLVGDYLRDRFDPRLRIGYH